MAINIIDHEAARRHLGDALDAIDKARVILFGANTSAEVSNGIIAAEDKVYEARFTIKDAIDKQTKESAP